MATPSAPVDPAGCPADNAFADLSNTNESASDNSVLREVTTSESQGGLPETAISPRNGGASAAAASVGTSHQRRRQTLTSTMQMPNHVNGLANQLINVYWTMPRFRVIASR